MEDLYSFLKQTSSQSDFKANLSERGGFITFSNSGRRGSVKYFQIGLDNILQTLKDILNHIDVFGDCTEYDERTWRDNGAAYFEDPVANANSTVQTKPLFSTLSKVIKWANQPELNDIDPDYQIVLTTISLSNAITKLEAIAESFRPKQRNRAVPVVNKAAVEDSSYLPYLTALRTKPFMLLAGISGTGKSRIVRELAFKSCPDYLQDKDGTTPGNYCMIEVKPNWHDSSELLGYYSNIAKGYQFTKFVKFLVKAMMFPKVPFFVCMDEMNLAPVEQYFAEFLSVLETRKNAGDAIQSGVLVDSKYFSNYGLTGCKNNGEVYMKLHETVLDNISTNESDSKSLIEKGLILPANVFIIGTVNMDDTTHQFSRKVIDRAMTIEMNGEDLTKMFDGTNNLEYLPEDQVWELAQFQPKYVSADEVLQKYDDEAKALKEQLTQRLTAINNELKDTPFVVSYRVLNELIIYAGVLLDDNKSLPEAIDAAVDRIALMKILPRIEGDEDMLGLATDENNRLCKLMPLVGEESRKKLKEMNNRLKTGFTRFWP